MNCVNKNFITDFVWNHEKEKKYEIETLAIDRVLMKNVCIEKLYRKCARTASPRLLAYFGEQRKTAIACNRFFKKEDILKGDYQKPLKKFNLFFSLNPVPLDGQSCQNQKGPWTSYQSLFRS